MDWTDKDIEQSNKRGIAVVHVLNAHEVAHATKEVEPEHWITVTFAVTALNFQQVLELDPLRKETILSIVGTGNCYICHSLTGASAIAQGKSTTDGALVAAPFSQKLSGTAPLWVVPASGATGMTASIWQSRRQG
jgi:hypothetical protein